MSNSLRIILILISAAIFAAAYWWHFSTSAELWKVNQEIERSWKKKDEAADLTVEQPEKKVVTETSDRLRSSGRDPIVLEGRGNYVTAKDLTFVVPKTMRRIQLTIQDHVGRRVTSYTLPNTFIGIRPGQRINLRVQE
jgi:hypothetical protein